MDNKLSCKLFIGCEINFLLRSALSQSSEWKIDKIEQTSLLEVQHGGKNYLGMHLPSEEIPVTQIRDLEQTIREKLLLYCPQIKPSSLNFSFFPQIFLH